MNCWSSCLSWPLSWRVLTCTFFFCVLLFSCWMIAQASLLSRIAWWVSIWVSGIGCWLTFPDHLPRTQRTSLLLGFCVMARFFCWDFPLSDDGYRYVWEGKLVRLGVNPYAQTAEAPQWSDLRDENWTKMNHKDKLTVYPPGSQLLFAMASMIFPEAWFFKLLFVIFDMGVVILLLRLLREMALPDASVLLYGLNPVALLGIAGEGHFDSVVVFFLLMALFYLTRKQAGRAWLFLGSAVQIKIIALVLLPLFLVELGWKKVLFFFLPLIFLSLPFLDHLPELGKGLEHFVGKTAFNGPIQQGLSTLTGSSSLGSQLSAGLFIVYVGGLTLSLWFRKKGKAKPSSPWRMAFYLMGGLLVFSPIVHYWYGLWVLAFIPLFPSIAWIYFSGISGLYFLTAYQEATTGVWYLPVEAQWFFWGPFFLFLARPFTREMSRTFQLFQGLLQGKSPMASQASSLQAQENASHKETSPQSYAVVIPTWNEATMLVRCLHSLHAMQPPPCQIIVADGGSTDDTVALARAKGSEVISSPRGRGAQIAAGVAHAQADILLILHADCECAPEIGGKILQALGSQPEIEGGSVGQRFTTSSFYLLFIESLNDLRASLWGVSFGDQGQFFRSEACHLWGGFPDLPLMEDVELSERMKGKSPLVYLGGGITTSPRRWEKEKFFQRIPMVLCFLLTYYRGRLFLPTSRRHELTYQLYEKYYGHPPPGIVQDKRQAR